jgi:hypothetical protein
MIKIEQISKALNSTELGMKGANERYAQFRQISCLEEWHEDADHNHKIQFKFKKTGENEEFNIYYKGQIRGNGSENRENRIASSKRFYNDKSNLNPGDEILFERIITINNSTNPLVEYFVDVNNYHDIIIFQNKSNCLEILNTQRFSDLINKIGNEFKVKYKSNIMNCKILILGFNECKLHLSSEDGTEYNIASINSDNLLKLDYNKMQLIEFDPLLYTQIHVD